MDENAISHIVIEKAIKVHKALGPGLLERTYRECLAYEIQKTGLRVEQERGLPLSYEEVHLNCGYRLDIFVESKFIVEVKSCDGLGDVHLAQLLTYLRLSGTKLGLLINFNVVLLKNGIRRVVNELDL